MIEIKKIQAITVGSEYPGDDVLLEHLKIKIDGSYTTTYDFDDVYLGTLQNAGNTLWINKKILFYRSSSCNLQFSFWEWDTGFDDHGAKTVNSCSDTGSKTTDINVIDTENFCDNYWDDCADSKWRVTYSISDPLGFNNAKFFDLGYLWSETGPTEVMDIGINNWEGDDLRVQFKITYSGNVFTWFS